MKRAILDPEVNLIKSIASLKPGDPVPVPPEPRSEEEIIANWKGDLARPLVSVVCLTYNHAGFIRDALNGFLMQKTDFPYEIIVHDDASTDGTIDILRQYQSRYPKIIKPYIQERNQYQNGISPLSFSFPLTAGKYIAFCEGDDYWIDEDKVFKQASFLETHPDISVVYSNSIPFHDGHCLGLEFGGTRADLTQEQLKMAAPIFTLTTCFRNVLDNPIELATSKYGDLTIWSRLGQYGTGKYMDDVLPSFYRVHSGGIHSSSGERQRQLMLMNTYFGLHAYYKRTGDSALEHYFFQKTLAIMSAVNGVSPKLIPAMRLFTTMAKRLKGLIGL